MQTETDKFEAIIEKYDKSQTTLETYEAISEFMQAILDMENFKKFEKAVDERSEMIFNARKELYNNKRYYENKEVDQQTETLFQMDTAWFLRELYAVHDCLKSENFTLGQIWLFKFTKPDEPMREYRKKEYRRDMNKVYKAVLPFLAQDEMDQKEETFTVAKERKDDNKEKEFRKVLKLEEDTKWEDIDMEFKDEYSVGIEINGNKLETDYEKMGFADRRKKSEDEAKPKASWNLLRIFSIKNNEFEYGKLSTKDRARFKKNKQKLSELLKKLFHIKEDPIIYDKETEIYKMKMKLKPEKEFQEQWQDRNIIEQPK